jgi:GntR family transcriptional regulator
MTGFLWREKLDKSGMVPLYRQLAQMVAKRIEGGFFSEGARIPSEPELMRRFGVSRVTVRLAMDDLFKRNLIVRKQGMGTFVKKKVMTQEVDDLFGFYPALLSKGLNPKIRILDYAILSPGREIQEKLDLLPGAKILRFSRQYLLEPSLFLVIRMHIPYDLAKNWIRKEAAEKNSFRLLQEKAGIRIHSSSLAIRAALASGRMGAWLKIAKGSPVLELRRLTYSTAKRPVEYAVLFFPGESYELKTAIFAGGENALKLGRQSRERSVNSGRQKVDNHS